MQDDLTDFGYQKVKPHEKQKMVRAVFDSVADNYDLMNDLMSLGIHRLWKRQALSLCQIRAGHCVLDVAGGTADMSRLLAPKIGSDGHLVLTDINHAMLSKGKNRLLDQGFIKNIDIVQANAECLPFQEHYFDRIMISFGLRNVTHKDKALQSMYRLLKPGGRLIVLEFSHPVQPLLAKLYDRYSFSVLPKLGAWIAKDQESYQYLAESIRMHPNQETLKTMMHTAGFDKVDYYNLSGGIVAIHQGLKF